MWQVVGDSKKMTGPQFHHSQVATWTNYDKSVKIVGIPYLFSTNNRRREPTSVGKSRVCIA